MKIIKLFKPADIALIIIIFTFAFTSNIFIPKFSFSQNVQLMIKKQGQTSVLPFSPDRKIRINGDPGYCLIEIKDKNVRVIESSCPDKICAKTGWISKPGENIICLPSRIVIEIAGNSLDVSLR